MCIRGNYTVEHHESPPFAKGIHRSLGMFFFLAGTAKQVKTVGRMARTRMIIIIDCRVPDSVAEDNFTAEWSKIYSQSLYETV